MFYLENLKNILSDHFIFWLAANFGNLEVEGDLVVMKRQCNDFTTEEMKAQNGDSLASGTRVGHLAKRMAHVSGALVQSRTSISETISALV